LALFSGGHVTSSTFTENDGGTISIESNSLLIDGRGRSGVNGSDDNFTGIGSLAQYDSDGGAAGNIVLNARALELRDGGVIDSSTFAMGHAGEISLDVGRMLIDDRGTGLPTGVASSSRLFTFNGKTYGGGAAGNIGIRIGEALSIKGGAIATSTASSGRGGNIMVNGPVVLIDDGSISSSTSGGGAAGTVAIDTAPEGMLDGAVSLRMGGSVSTDTVGFGDAGAVAIRTGTLSLEGKTTAITSTTSAAGAAGSVMVDALSVALAGGGKVSSDASTGATGEAGSVTVTAPDIVVAEAAQISASTAGPGKAGQVSVSGARLMLVDGGGISSGTSGRGDGGDVRVAARETLAVNGGRIETNSDSGGQAGNVTVTAPWLRVEDDGVIGSSGSGSGAAGGVMLRAGTFEVENASIRTAGAGSRGGRIDIAAEDLIHLKDAEVTSSGIKPGVGASIITLTAPLIALNDSRVTSLTGTGQSLEGSGLAQLFGDVTVISADSVVDASSSVTLTGAEGDIGSQLVVPESVFLNVGDLLWASCAARRTGKASSFTAMGRGGLPPDPAGPLAASYRERGGVTATGQAGPVLAASFGDGCKAAPDG
jgi:large exoprotein involved in heme utilization and adhesion